MRRLIEDAYPDHGILGEEHGPVRLDAEHVWVLDPIDGTRSFISGIPLWATLIGLKRDGRPAAGMTTLMHIDERYRRVEIGATWYAKSCQRTVVNTESKLLLMTHAFEQLECIAVEFVDVFSRGALMMAAAYRNDPNTCQGKP